MLYRMGNKSILLENVSVTHKLYLLIKEWRKRTIKVVLILPSDFYENYYQMSPKTS